MSGPQLEFTLKQLAQMALGAPDFSDINVILLHTLVDILLKKLNCANEKVFIGGHEAKILDKIRKESAQSPLKFHDEHVETIEENWNKVSQVEEMLNTFDIKLAKHLEEIQKLLEAEEVIIDSQNLAPKEIQSDAFITECDDYNEAVCHLIHDDEFLAKILRRVSDPIILRVFEFEKKIEKLHEKLSKYLNAAGEENTRIELIAYISEQIAELRRKVDYNKTFFLGTMEEVQDLLDSRVDKVNVPGLKKVLKLRFEKIIGKLEALQEAKKCPKVPGIMTSGLRCVMCGTSDICAEKGVYPTSVLPSMSPRKGKDVLKIHRNYCHCVNEHGDDSPSKIHERVHHLDIPFTQVQLKGRSDGANECLSPGSDFKLLEGFDGNFYRQA